MAVNAGNSAFGRVTFSPARCQRPQMVVRHRHRYSTRFPCMAKFAPVPALTIPRFVPCVANSSAAESSWASGRSARSATYAGVKPETARARSSKPDTFSSTNAASCHPLAMMMLMIPARIVTSSPGRGCRWMAARAAVWERRGSTTISFMPRSVAARRLREGF